MGNLSKTGHIFYGVAITVMGLQMVYYKDFPYMLLPPNYALIPGISIITFIFGILFILAGACIVLEKKVRLAACY